MMLCTEVKDRYQHIFEAGDVKFVDMNGDAVIDEKDMVMIGDPNRFYGRFFTGFNVSTLSATVTCSAGGDIYNYQKSFGNGSVS